MSTQRRVPPVIGKSMPPPLSGGDGAAVPPRLPGSERLQQYARVFKSLPPPIPKSLLNPAELERFKNLLLFARATVEGYFIGRHKSPRHGASVEFTDYKQYVAGDEISRIDWRVWGRTRRLFVRQFQAETDMSVYLLVDTSNSMNYRGNSGESKFVLAAKIAAALSYLMIRQGDKAALGLFADALKDYIPAGGTVRHLHRMVSKLEAVKPSSTTGVASALAECNGVFRKRGRLVILSDFWDDHDQLLDALSQFLHRRFEILLLHVVHPDELDLPSVNSARFQDMETEEIVEVEPDEIRLAYSRTVREHIDRLAREASGRQISHTVVNTKTPYLSAIEAYLGFRGENTLGVR
jgi:Uncharacterized conserved protein (some members contain a von Willebrand factor type A (vWA) domain)